MTTTTDRSLLERRERIMACEVSIHVATEPEGEEQACAAIDDCVTWLREVEAALTRFDAASELSRLNAASGTWRPVSELLMAVTEQSVAAARASGGLFDPTTLPMLEAAGYDRDFASFAHGDVSSGTDGGAPTPTCGAWEDIALDRARRRVRLPRGARLDFGGIAKGWAADVALERFFSGVAGVLINIGGDMRVRGGPSADEPWPLGIGDPRDDSRHAAVLALGSGGLATSGATARWWRRNGARQHHLIDPRTGRPARLWIDAEDDAEAATLIATASALAPTAAHAEVAAKVALLRGYPDALQAVEAAWDGAQADDVASVYGDAGIALLLVLGSGEVVCSATMAEYLKHQGSGGDLWLD
jgi:thiamine biosynthesis lipoprotein